MNASLVKKAASSENSGRHDENQKHQECEQVGLLCTQGPD